MTQVAWVRRRLNWLLGWTVLTAAGVCVHAMAWVSPDAHHAGLSAIAETAAVKPGANALDVAVGPVWLAMALIVGDWGVYSPLQSTFAHGVTAAMVLLAVRKLLRWRRAIAARVSRAGGTPVDAARRRFLMESPLGAAVLLGGGTVMLGAAIEPFSLKLRRHRVPISGLPGRLDGVRLVFIADTHLGPRVPASFIERAVAESIALKPDVMLLGGDYVHAGSRYIEPAALLFKPIMDAGIPCVGVLGNHDWYNSRGLIASRLAALGVMMVDNRHVLLDARSRRIGENVPEDEALCIAGVGDLLAGTVDVDAALRGVPPGVPRILLSHNPDVAELTAVRSAVPRRIDLMLSGHTHGGQVSLPLIGPLHIPGDYGRKYAGGLVQGPAFPVLVSRGVGMSICPVRIGVPPEIVEVTLVRGNAT